MPDNHPTRRTPGRRRNAIAGAAALALLLALPALPLDGPGSAVALAGGGAEAQAGERASDKAARLDALYAALARTESLDEAQALEDRIWRLWMQAPDAEAQRLLDRAMERRRRGDVEGATAALDRLIARNPEYPEGWNQRATLRFLDGEDEASLADVEEVLKREPRHFGALAGKALILLRQGRTDAAQRALLAALRVHPWLPERGLLDPAYEETPL